MVMILAVYMLMPMRMIGGMVRLLVFFFKCGSTLAIIAHHMSLEYYVL